jgi:hypothetical protein
LRSISPEVLPAFEKALTEDERSQFRGEPARRQAIVSSEPTIPALFRSKDAIDFYLQDIPAGIWENEITVRSIRAARMYEPGVWIGRVSPTPLMLIVALEDPAALTDLSLSAYEDALEPKRLVLIQGGHFDAYLSKFSSSAGNAVEWFREHLN